MTHPRLLYFSSRGRAESIRLLLAEAGVAYEEENMGLYTPGQPLPKFVALKETGKLAFDALPAWEEPDGFILVQSDAIAGYLARKHDLCGTDARAAARCDMVREGVKDTIAHLAPLRTAEPAQRPALRASLGDGILPRWLGHFERLLLQNQGGDHFIVGQDVTWADIALFHMVEILTDNGLAGGLAACPKLAGLVERIGNRPRISTYLASPDRFPPQLLPT